MTVTVHNRIRTSVACLLLAALVLTLCSCFGAQTPVTGTEVGCFDTESSYTWYAPVGADREAFDRVFRTTLQTLHKAFDIYHEYADTVSLCEVNRRAGSETVTVPEDTAELLRMAKEYAVASDSACNFAIGALTSVWHRYREEGTRVPTSEELQTAAAHCNPEDVILEGNTVRFADPELRLDLGAIAKGYAADALRQALRCAGFDNFLLNVGGMILVSGEKPSGDWTVGVGRPTGEGYLATGTVEGDEALSTSGSYQRYYEVDGVKYHHIVDGDTLYPATYFDSVTVIAPSACLADALSTALFCITEEEGRALLARYPGTEAMWLDRNGTLTRTDGFLSE